MSRLRSRLSDRCGNVSLIFALSLTVLVGSAAAGVTYGGALGTRTKMQGALDAAVLAAAGLPSSATPDQRIELAKSTYAENLAAAGATWITSGASDMDTGRLPAFLVSADLKVTGEAVAEVEIPFAGVLGVEPIAVAARSAATRGYSAPICLLALNQSEEGGFDLNGNTRVDATNCSAMTNSSDNKAMRMVGTASANALQFGVAGDVKGQNFRPVPVTGVEPVQDPFADVPFPPLGPCVDAASRLRQTVATLSPGTYCGGIDIMSQSEITLLPGVYVMDGGMFRVGADAIVKGDGVTIAFTGKNADLWLSSGANVTLSAPKTGPTAGFVFFMDRRVAGVAGGWATIIGGVKLVYDGIFYYPGRNIWIAGGSEVVARSPGFAMVADKLWFQDGSTTRVTVTDPEIGATPTRGHMRLGAMLVH